MKRTIIKTMTLAMVLFLMTMSTGKAIMTYDPGVNYNKYVKYDRYLDVEIWVDDDSYYEGDNIDISFRANKDCYVAIYNIDSRGRVNMIFPNSPGDNNYIEANAIYNLPDRNDSYDLTVQGPEGVEYLQIVASSRPIDIPNWFGGSGIVCDVDPYDFMDYINANYFGGRDDLPRAFDLTSFVVREWRQYYFRPYYTHYYDPWDWGYCGSVYIDYPFGATIYVDGVYWGIAPLFIPRIYFGWHYITVYDYSGWCWEDRVDIVRHRSIVLDNSVIRTKAGVKSRFREVNSRGYLNPVKNGYPDYDAQVRAKKTHKPVSTVNGNGRIKYAAEKDVRTIRENSYKYRTSSSTESREAYKGSDRRTKETSTRGKSSAGVEKRRSTDRERDYSTERTYRKTNSDRSSGSTESRTYRKTESNRSSGSTESRTYRKTESDRSSGSTKSRTYKRSNGSRNSSGSNRSSSSTRSKSSGGSSRVTHNSGNTGSSSNSPATKTRGGGQSGNTQRRGK